ncbi:MAG: SUMF1/EgtB/PvdO family nonheme iron enzyme [Planctomycetota bacterium]
MSPQGSQSPDPAPEDSLAAKLKARFGEGVDPGVSLHAADETGEKQPDFSSALVARLSGRSGSFGRYQVKGEIARGGMGAILKIWDEDLHRHLAMKVILGQVEVVKAAGKDQTPPIETSRLARFLEEAQVTGQLDHPGIVPVHELGLDPGGRVYFTMKLVKGQSLKEVFDLVAEGKEGWSQTKALGVLLKVCEAMAYAHDKGVIHRDLKPANVMVGKFGEVHVMDWGLARIMGRDDERDIRIREEAPRSSTELRSERDEHRGETPESPLYTMDGDVVGTPAYMPPEQAAGRVSEIGPHSDVYAVGAMIYHLIAGQMPYVPGGARLNNYAVWGLVQQGPPTPIAQLARGTPAELVAICEKAMARDWKRRYRNMSEMAEDLSAYLEHRVVGAYETGAWAETKKWVERNWPLAAAMTAGILALVAGLVVSISLKRMADANAKLAKTNENEARQQKSIAQENERLAIERANAVLSLSALEDLKALKDRAEALWPANPKMVPKYEAWLADARRVIEVAGYEAWLGNARSVLGGQIPDEAERTNSKPGPSDLSRRLAEVDSRAVPQSEEEREAELRSHPRFQELLDAREHLENLVSKLNAQESASGSSVDGKLSLTQQAALRNERDHLQVDVAALEREISRRRNWVFPNREDQILHALLSMLVNLEEFTDPRTGLASSGVSVKYGWSIERRLEFARTIEERSVNGAEAKARWALAIESIRTPARSPQYDGLAIAPQLGLLPIGQDAESGLWEFADLATGEPAERDPSGRIVLKESTGIVFVLIPGGTFLMGAQAEDPAADHFDPNAQRNESPVQPVNLEPFFLSKYEMTQAQWERLTSDNPSLYSANNQANEWSSTGRLDMPLHPVEQVSWEACNTVLPRFGMSLPTEAQWEYACRAGTDTVYWSGNESDLLGGVANISDGYGKSHGNEHYAEWDPWLDDGQTVHARVGTYRANPFGLFDMHGNVWEWCRDRLGAYSLPVLPGDGEREVTEPISWAARTRVFRGGSFAGTAVYARSARRNVDLAGRVGSGIGLRPAMALQRSASQTNPAGK